MADASVVKSGRSFHRHYHKAETRDRCFRLAFVAHLTCLWAHRASRLIEDKTDRQARCPPVPQTRCLRSVSIYHSLVEVVISIDAAISQEWPMCALLVYVGPVHMGEHNLFFIGRTFRNDLPVWSANKALSPEFNAIVTSRRFVANAV
jgi:hypothetical protein